MYYLRSPADEKIVARLTPLASSALTYDFEGSTLSATDGPTPDGYRVDRVRLLLGTGKECFERAVAAVFRFQNYPPSFTRVVALEPEIAEGTVFGTIARHWGFYSLNPCRVIGRFDEHTTGQRRCGYALGTLRGHAESGEECFEVRWVLGTDEVEYRLVAISRPATLLARAAAPITRGYQRRFQRESCEAMAAAVQR